MLAVSGRSSSLSWMRFTAFHLDVAEGHRHYLPIFTLGRYAERDGRTLMPFAVQVHHAGADGFHVARLVDELQDLFTQPDWIALHGRHVLTGSRKRSTVGSVMTFPTDRVRGAGMRVTRPRLAILEWLSDHPHSTADQVRSGALATLGTLSTQAAYDVLAAFTAAGLVRRIEPAGHPARFECRTGDNHHHVVCRGCGLTEDVDCAVGDAPCLTASDGHDYSIDESEVVFWGWCPACQTAHPEQPYEEATP